MVCLLWGTVETERCNMVRTEDVRLFGVTWRSRTISMDWQTRVVVPIFKKRDRRVCSNYWIVTVLSLGR